MADRSPSEHQSSEASVTYQASELHKSAFEMLKIRAETNPAAGWSEGDKDKAIDLFTKLSSEGAVQISEEEIDQSSKYLLTSYASHRANADDTIKEQYAIAGAALDRSSEKISFDRVLSHLKTHPLQDWSKDMRNKAIKTFEMLASDPTASHSDEDLFRGGQILESLRRGPLSDASDKRHYDKVYQSLEQNVLNHLDSWATSMGFTRVIRRRT